MNEKNRIRKWMKRIETENEKNEKRTRWWIKDIEPENGLIEILSENEWKN